MHSWVVWGKCVPCPGRAYQKRDVEQLRAVAVAYLHPQDWTSSGDVSKLEAENQVSSCIQAVPGGEPPLRHCQCSAGLGWSGDKVEHRYYERKEGREAQ